MNPGSILLSTRNNSPTGNRLQTIVRLGVVENRSSSGIILFERFQTMPEMRTKIEEKRSWTESSAGGDISLVPDRGVLHRCSICRV